MIGTLRMARPTEAGTSTKMFSRNASAVRWRIDSIAPIAASRARNGNNTNASACENVPSGNCAVVSA